MRKSETDLPYWGIGPGDDNDGYGSGVGGYDGSISNDEYQDKSPLAPCPHCGKTTK